MIDRKVHTDDSFMHEFITALHSVQSRLELFACVKASLSELQGWQTKLWWSRITGSRKQLG